MSFRPTGSKAFAVLIRNRLKDKNQQNQHPHIESSAETRTVKERERGEKGSAKGNQRRKGQFPLPAQRIDDQISLRIVPAYNIEHPLPSLYEEQKHQQCPQQRYDDHQ